MKKEELNERFRVAHEAVKAGSLFLLSHKSLRTKIHSKAENDYVTEADKECERLIVSQILHSFPDDAIYGEESGKIEGNSKARWIIDPIDGTVDFMIGFPNYTISVAFEDEEGIAFGLVSVPSQDELFTAFRGEGAYLNGERINTDEKTSNHKQVIIMVPPHRHHEKMDSFIVKFRKLYEVFSDMRSVGSAACSLCYVASGRAEAYYEIGLHIYDCAAGIIIVTEAGGKITLINDDEDWIEIAASSSFIHEKLLEVVVD